MNAETQQIEHLLGGHQSQQPLPLPALLTLRISPAVQGLPDKSEKQKKKYGADTSRPVSFHQRIVCGRSRSWAIDALFGRFIRERICGCGGLVAEADRLGVKRFRLAQPLPT